MKQIYRRAVLLALFTLFNCLDAEIVYNSGHYNTAGTVNGDLVVTSGNVIVNGDLTIDGDLKVTSGKVVITSGSLKVDGDLIVTNTNIHSSPGEKSATVRVDDGDIEVSGSIITNSKVLHAWVSCKSIYAGRVSTQAYWDSYLEADHHIKVNGEICTRSENSTAHIRSHGSGPIYGDISAGSIITFQKGEGYANIRADNGHIIVSGPIFTYATGDASIYAEGTIRAGSITTYSEYMYANIAGERIDVDGDIFTYAPFDGSDCNVEARGPSPIGTPEEVIATNIYVKGDKGYSSVTAYKNIDVKGNIGLLSELELGGSEASVKASNGYLRAKNITTRTAFTSQIRGYEIDVKEDILTRSWFTDCTSYSGDIKARNLYVFSGILLGDSHVTSDGNIVVDGTLRTESTAGDGYVEAVGDVNAGKAFLKGQGSSYLECDVLKVRGPLTLNSVNSDAYVESTGDIDTGSISTDGDELAYVRSANGSIKVTEDVHTKSNDNVAYVRALNGDIDARSIRTEPDGGYDGSIKAKSGTGRFKLVPKASDKKLTVKDCDFSLDSDYDWDTYLILEGDCRIDGRGHFINFGITGGFVVAPGASLYLQNIKLRRVGDGALICQDDTSKLSLYDVTWTQTQDCEYKKGKLDVVGDVCIRGAGHKFKYQSSENLKIFKNATLKIDNGVTLAYNTNDMNRLVMEDKSSRLHFDDGILDAEDTIRLKKGTLRWDNKVFFNGLNGSTIFIGNSNLPENLTLEYGQGSKLHYSGSFFNNNVEV